MKAKALRIFMVEAYAEKVTHLYHAGQIEFSEALRCLVSHKHWRDEDWGISDTNLKERLEFASLMILPRTKSLI